MFSPITIERLLITLNHWLLFINMYLLYCHNKKEIRLTLIQYFDSIWGSIQPNPNLISDVTDLLLITGVQCNRPSCQKISFLAELCAFAHCAVRRPAKARYFCSGNGKSSNIVASVSSRWVVVSEGVRVTSSMESAMTMMIGVLCSLRVRSSYSSSMLVELEHGWVIWCRSF